MDESSKSSDLSNQYSDDLPYVQPQWQLVLEIYASSVQSSIDFYTNLGFTLEWSVPNYFAQLSWDDGCLLFLKATPKSDATAHIISHSRRTVGNLRIMIPDVDAKYEQCLQLGYTVVQELGDRKFVLRDFVVRDPDGFKIRFESFLPGRGRKEQEGPEHEIVVREVGF